MKEWVSVNQDTIINPGEEAEIEFNACIPEGIEYGYYSGKVKVTLRR